MLSQKVYGPQHCEVQYHSALKIGAFIQNITTLYKHLFKEEGREEEVKGGPMHVGSKIVHREGSTSLILLFNTAALSVCSWHKCGTVILLCLSGISYPSLLVCHQGNSSSRDLDNYRNISNYTNNSL